MSNLIKLCVVGFVCMIFDVVTGVIGPLKDGEFKSSVMREGGFHKLALVIVMAFGVFLTYAQGMVDLGMISEIPVGSSICSYIIIMEICSMFENVDKAFPGMLPSFITKRFYSAKMRMEEDTDEEEQA